jgi:hypothetical protein
MLNLALPHVVFCLGLVLILGLPVLCLAAHSKSEEEARRKVGRCGFVE